MEASVSRGRSEPRRFLGVTTGGKGEGVAGMEMDGFRSGARGKASGGKTQEDDKRGARFGVIKGCGGQGVGLTKEDDKRASRGMKSLVSSPQ